MRRRKEMALLAALAACAVGATAATAGQESATAGQGFKVVGQWGKNGTGNSQFATTDGLVVDKSGTVYVADTDNNRVQVFSATGTFLRKWGTVGDGNGQFHGAEDVDIAPDGTIWVADYGNSRVQQFKPDGTFLTMIDIYGFKEGASGIAVDADGNLLIAVIGETYGGIRRFDKTPTGYVNKGLIGRGEHRSEDSEVSPDGTIYQLTDAPGGSQARMRRYAADGTALGSFALSSGGMGFGVDLDCNIWILDAPNRRNVKHSPSGKALATATAPDLVAKDTAVNSKGDLYVIQNSPLSIIHFAEDKKKPGTANVPKAIAVKGGKATVVYTGSGFACPAQVAAMATLKGSGVSGRSTTKVAAGKKTPIAMTVHGPAGKTVKATFTIVLKTNGRPTTETKTVKVTFGK
jgi:NHL repeat-containing protein